MNYMIIEPTGPTSCKCPRAAMKRLETPETHEIEKMT